MRLLHCVSPTAISITNAVSLIRSPPLLHVFLTIYCLLAVPRTHTMYSILRTGLFQLSGKGSRV